MPRRCSSPTKSRTSTEPYTTENSAMIESPAPTGAGDFVSFANAQMNLHLSTLKLILSPHFRTCDVHKLIHFLFVRSPFNRYYSPVRMVCRVRGSEAHYWQTDKQPPGMTACPPHDCSIRFVYANGSDRKRTMGLAGTKFLPPLTSQMVDGFRSSPTFFSRV